MTEVRIMEALTKVQDPELHKSLVELGMIGELEIKGDNVRVQVLLTTPKCPMKATIGQDIRNSLLEIEGINTVEVVFGELNREQKAILTQKLYGEREKANPLKNTQVIAVGSGKGGVGKSSVTAMLALTLGKMGYRVGLIDADVLGYSIPQILGIRKEKPTMVEGTVLLPIESNGIKVLSMGNLVDNDEAFVWRGPMLGKVLEQFIYDFYWGELDFMLIDMPPGTGDVPLSVMQMIPETKVLIVTTPQPFATGVARRLGSMAAKMGNDVVGIIENMSYFICDNCDKKHDIFGKGETETLCGSMGTRLLGKIPFVPLDDKPESGESFSDFTTRQELTDAFGTIAQNLIQAELHKRNSKGL